MNKLLKYLPAALIVASAFVGGVAHAQVTAPNYFLKVATSVYPLNPASTTFGTSTLNGVFKNINVNGTCTGCGATSTGVTSFNGATGTVTYAPSTTIPTNNNQLTNGSNFITNSPSSLSVLNTSTASVIENFDNVLEVPAPYTTSTYGDFGDYATNWIKQQVAAGRHAVAIHINPDGIPSGAWTHEIVASSTGTTVVISCPSLALVNWTGSNTSTFMNPGTAANETFGSGWQGCYINGNGRSNQTFLEFGGNNGAYSMNVANNTIFNFHQGLVSGSNAPFVNVSNNNFQYVDQPIFFNFAVGTVNVGENTLLNHNIFGGCEASNILGTGASSSIYIVNGAGVDGVSNSLDDCTLYWGNGTTGRWGGGWVENPGVNVTPYQGVAIIQVATSTTNSLLLDGLSFLNDTSSTTSTVNGQPSIPPWYIENDGYLSIQGGTASANGTASSVAMLVHPNGTAFTQVCDFLNTVGSTNAGLLSMVNGGYSLTKNLTGTGQGCVTVNQNSYPYYERTAPNVHTWSFGTGDAMSLTTGLGGNGNDQGLSVGNGGGSTVKQATSTIDDQNTLGLSSSQFSATTSIPAVDNASTILYTCTGGTNTNIYLPLASSTQNRSYIFTSANTTGPCFVNATSTDHIFATSSATIFTINTSTPLRVTNENGSTWYAW